MTTKMEFPVCIPIGGEPDLGAVEQMQMCLEDDRALAGALMGDHHLGYSMPIGGVIAYDNAVSPSGVGYDIACGNKAVRFNVDAATVQCNINQVMDRIYSEISFGIGRKNKEEIDHPLFDDPTWDLIKELGRKQQKLADLKQMARQQLGTVGSGNHYVDLFVDVNEQLWCGVHFGSRGLGHRIATHFIKAGGGKDGMYVKPVVLDADSELGMMYIACMQLAGRYAYVGRDWVCNKVAEILGAKIVEEVHNHHNFAWSETHKIDGKLRDVWVVRKGATPAEDGQRGFIGSTMAEQSVIVEGRAGPDSDGLLRSTVHGAGRTMGRREAAGKRKWSKEKKQFVRVTEGKISPQMMTDWVREAGVELRGAGTDESPHCYKRLSQVLEIHGSSIDVKNVLTPMGVAMAGDDEFDPYKD